MYRADGLKVRKINQGVSATGITDYLDGFQYNKSVSENEFKIQFVPTAEGYYDFANNRYTYNYVDHLGNVRLSYADSNKNGVIDPSKEIIEENNYYPFGLKHSGYNNLAGNPKYQYKYNGKELQETGMYDYGARMYMPDIGRWGVVDPLAEKYPSWSPYTYVKNNPLNLIDPTGMGDEDPKIKISDVRKAFSYFNSNNYSSIRFTLYVDQPVPGSTEKAVISELDVGHSFIGITMVGKDGKKVTQTFGFYPDHDRGTALGGSPFDSDNISTFKNNSKHDYDEKVSIDINESQFGDIMELAEKFEQQQYDLNKRNCTDFALSASNIAGIDIKNTKGTWLLGGGNNPADTGQQILSGNVKNKSTGNKQGLKIDVSRAEVRKNSDAWRNASGASGSW